MATATDQAKTVELKGTVVDAAGAPLKAVRLWLWQDHETQRTESLPDGTFAFPKALPQPAGLVAFRDDLAIGGMKVPVPAFEPVKLTLTEKDSLAIKTVNASFDPVVGARIKALLVNDAFSVPVDDLTPEGFPSFRSDDNGLLVFNNLPKSGHVRLMAAHREFADTSVAYLPIGGKPLPVVLYAGVRLRGRVTSHDNKGAARARLTLVRKASGAQDVAEFVTDPEGFYNVMVRADEYYVAVRHPNFSSPKPSLFVPSDQEDGNVLDLALLPPHIIQGTVVLPDGKACPGTPVSYFIDRVLYQETLTQHDGSFSLNVPDGPGQIHVLPPNGLMTETLNDIPVDKPQPQMQLAPIKLKSLPLIEGICQNNDGAPLPNTLISSLDLKPAAWAIAGPDGRFKFSPTKPKQPSAPKPMRDSSAASSKLHSRT
jgi:hypothetical protein